LLRRIPKNDVSVGMFVHAFEGSWLQNPFWRSSFLLTRQSELDTILASEIDHVVIDESRGKPFAQAEPLPSPERRRGTIGAQLRSAQGWNAALSFADERVLAKKLIVKASREMKDLFARAHRGEGVSVDKFAELTEDIMASVERNPHALIALTRLKDRDEYTYVHSLAVSALLISFGRSVGKPEPVIFEIGLAGLLHDIGKMHIPDSVLNKTGALNAEEMKTIRAHPEQGYHLLKQNPAIPQLVLDICRYHHERVDGSGYPHKLPGERLSRAVRMSAICDVYDALTSHRPYKEAWSPVEAVTRMSEWTGHFDQQLLFRFMKVVGVYPPGRLVRLRSNRLGVTMPNGQRASRPLVRAFYCAREFRQLPVEDVVIGHDLPLDQIISEEYPLEWGITAWPIVSEQLMRGEPVTIGPRPEGGDMQYGNVA
jgi:HD-GYP domain-containing protein (c-di-GMP phosphodiesterase class II)